MKKILFLFSSCVLGLGAYAQTYFSDDFSSGNMNNWTRTDADGDGANWLVRNYNDGIQNQHASSSSWHSNQETPAGALTPDNWMVSNVIDLTSATGTVYFTWKVYAQDQAWPSENYSVYVSTSNSIATMTTEGAMHTEVLTVSNGYMSRSLDISSMNGQEIYVAFRHHNVTDMFRMNIDDVLVKTVPNNDLEVLSITVDSSVEGDRTFSINILNQGINNVTDFDIDWSFDGGAPTTVNVTGINLAFGQIHTIEVPINGITESTNVPFMATITTVDDDNSNNSLTTSFNFIVPIRQYIANDTYGNSFNLYNALENGQAVILDFMASWCGPCQSSTPEISQLVQNNGSGEGRLQALAISVEPTDNATVLNGLNWNGGFYNYPKFAYIAENDNQWDHYAYAHGFNSGNGIPFFVMICPNRANPSRSEIIKVDVGYGSGMFGAYQTALNACPSAVMSINVNDAQELTELNIFPNPATESATLTFTADSENTTVDVINSLGQKVYSVNLGSVNGKQTVTIPTNEFSEGLYFVNVQSTNGSTATARLSVVK